MIKKIIHTKKEISLSKEVKKARAYVCGLGLYEMEINGITTGNEYFAPGCNAYDKWIQYQTYDIRALPFAEPTWPA